MFFRILIFKATFGHIVLGLRFRLVGADAPRRGHIPSRELLLVGDPANRHEAQNQSPQDEKRTETKRCVASVGTVGHVLV